MPTNVPPLRGIPIAQSDVLAALRVLSPAPDFPTCTARDVACQVLRARHERTGEALKPTDSQCLYVRKQLLTLSTTGDAEQCGLRTQLANGERPTGRHPALWRAAPAS